MRPLPRRPAGDLQLDTRPLISTGRQTLQGDPPALPVAAGGRYERLNLRDCVCSPRGVGRNLPSTRDLMALSYVDAAFGKSIV